jgi:predicted DNA-binding transcriptional regulator AlpA
MPTAATLDSTPTTFNPETDDRLIIARAVARRLGISLRTLERWVKADNIAFPEPDLITRDVLGRPANRFWRLSTILQWEAHSCRPKLGRPALDEKAVA